jgi:hypothetical protein
LTAERLLERAWAATLLRDRADFRELMQDLAFPPDPFATGAGTASRLPAAMP